MVLRDLYKDINSKINQGVYQDEILANDVLVAINDAIAGLRIEYVGRGLGQSFSVTEQYYTTEPDVNYPFLRSEELDYTPLKTAPITNSILNLVAFVSENDLTDNVGSFSSGDVAVRQDAQTGALGAYVCVTTHTNTNTYAKIFDKSKLRKWRSMNGLKYNAGDVVYDGTSYWLLEETFVNDKAYTFSETGVGDLVIDATQVYWMSAGRATVTPSFYEFDRVNEMQLTSLNNYPVYTVKDNMLYVSNQINRITITYVPEWEYVYDLDTVLKLPTDMIPAVKQRALAGIAIKLRGGSTGESE